MPKQTSSDLFFNSGVAGQAFHTHMQLHTLFLHSHGAGVSGIPSPLLNLLNSRKNMDTEEKQDPNEHDISDNVSFNEIDLFQQIWRTNDNIAYKSGSL